MRILAAAAVLLPIVVIGCGSGETAGIALSGRVSYRGKPIEAGMIFFQPELDTRSRTAVGQIDRGYYSISSQEGPQKGKFRIEVFTGPIDKWYDESSPGSIPAKYNAKSTLNIDIPKRKSLEYNIELD